MQLLTTNHLHVFLKYTDTNLSSGMKSIKARSLILFREIAQQVRADSDAERSFGLTVKFKFRSTLLMS